jgi:hypothetical protein
MQKRKIDPELIRGLGYSYGIPGGYLIASGPTEKVLSAQ